MLYCIKLGKLLTIFEKLKVNNSWQVMKLHNFEIRIITAFI